MEPGGSELVAALAKEARPEPEVGKTKCPCGGRRSLGVMAPPLAIAPAQAPPQQDSFELPVDDGAGDPSYPE